MKIIAEIIEENSNFLTINKRYSDGTISRCYIDKLELERLQILEKISAIIGDEAYISIENLLDEMGSICWQKGRDDCRGRLD